MPADIAKLLEQMRANPAGVRVTDACKVVTAYFGELRQEAQLAEHIGPAPW